MTGSNYGLCWLAIIWGAVVGAVAIIAFIQERRIIQRGAVIGGWFGAACLFAVALGALILLSVGVF